MGNVRILEIIFSLFRRSVFVFVLVTRDKKFLKQNLFRGQHFEPLCRYLNRDIDFVGKVANNLNGTSSGSLSLRNSLASLTRVAP